jgi:hypothetical protein
MNRIAEKIILKTSIFPHSGGKNQGGTAKSGRVMIKKNPVKTKG